MIACTFNNIFYACRHRRLLRYVKCFFGDYMEIKGKVYQDFSSKLEQDV